MSEVAVSRVEEIIKSLSELENNIDSLDEKVKGSGKELQSKCLNEIEKLREKVVRMATKEAESIISVAREDANKESKKIQSEGEKKIGETKKKIDNKFDEAVDDVVSFVLKS